MKVADWSWSVCSRLASLALIVVMSGCDPGFEIEGTVKTSNVTSRDRATVVFLVQDPVLDAQGKLVAGKSPLAYSMVRVASLQAPEIPFRHSGHCGARKIVVAAWARLPGRMLPEASQGLGKAFAPEPGDLVSTSELITPGCSSRGAQRIDITIADANAI